MPDAVEVESPSQDRERDSHWYSSAYYGSSSPAKGGANARNMHRGGSGFFGPSLFVQGHESNPANARRTTARDFKTELRHINEMDLKMNEKTLDDGKQSKACFGFLSFDPLEEGGSRAAGQVVAVSGSGSR